MQTLRYPDKKAEADGIMPLSDEAVAFRMEQIRRIYDDFVSSIAAGLGISREKVESDFGQGRSLDARDAVRVGMASRIATFDSLLAEHMSGAIKRRNSFQRTSLNRASRAQAVELMPQRNADFCATAGNCPALRRCEPRTICGVRWRLVKTNCHTTGRTDTT